MAADFISEMDRDFYKDNFLTDMDFNLADIGVADQLEFDLSFPEYPSVDYLLGQLPANDETFSMLQDDQVSDHSASSDYFTDIGDSSSSDQLNKAELHSSSLSPSSRIKAEPSSPCPSPASSKGSPKAKSLSSSQRFSQIEIVKLESPTLPSLHDRKHSSTILSHTINIQPKPLQAKQALDVTALSCQQPLVLTAEEFSKLKAQGILKLQPIGVKTEVNHLSSSQRCDSDKCVSETELKALKRHQRMLKNRESASLSRKKKKEYLLNLEQKIHEQAMLNEHLRKENELLKKQVESLQSENILLKKSSSSKFKKTTCLVVLLFLVTFNFNPLSIFTNQNKVVHPVPQAIRHWHTRSLLWEDAAKDASLIDNFNYTLDADGSLDGITCPLSINKTESLRLADELTGWVMRHEKQLDNKKKRKHGTKKVFPLKRFNVAIPKNLNTIPKLNIPTNGGNPIRQIQIYEWREKPFENFMSAIHRRDDTFYVVSFRGDHLLLPATAHNKTQRPRMSLVMPAIPLNETMQPPANHIAMMQIDCEVMDAKLVHLKESLIPEHLRENRTAATPHLMSSLVTQNNGT